ncbi:SpoIID/LytB domain-containing protein [Carboxylicivirga marina]|uniref:SpoIID/LytB domain-containing protein n=1 Tax=Carboxylicivirga marina TaxID=2800988 RepID=A0ABS1HGY1_9BACT|nr:SpoIID/LytB domain-containing protein [Carboxylicivirga marina]MBK3516735.1 SpoIID/LytB domain-containing protein [Carboxylicivirga marina]
MKNTPFIQVGIQFKETIAFTLNGTYKHSSGVTLTSGKYKVSIAGNVLELVQCNNGEEILIRNGLLFEPKADDAFFTIHDVTIGINFHWERDEDQSFKGGLKLITENEKITAINVLSVEDYLMSVISSEMSATSSLELLKAHAVISRSWLLAQIEKNNSLQQATDTYQSVYQSDEKFIKWYDREDHINFDVCADDHCQRYQGITKANTSEVVEAVKNTWGEVLMNGEAICDARFSKCCGGMVEKFENVWEPVNHPYLQAFVDNDNNPDGFELDLTNESNAEKWILGSPDAFCNTNNKEVLIQVLNDYDQETNDFYRWSVSYTQKDISELLKKRTGFDFGIIQDLIPVKRGDSGRLIELKIIGDKKSLTIGKELEIRKALSESHLYSSAFIIEKAEVNGEVNFTLKGAGWGHGVGLCQIGAAVMGAKGYNYNAILMHYFRGTELKKKY